MKLSCHVNDLLPLVRNASRVVSNKREGLVSVSCVLLSVDGNRVSLTGSDFTTWITTATEVQDAIGQWSVGLPGFKLMGILSTLKPGDKIDLEVKKGFAILRAGRGKYKLVVTPESEFAGRVNMAEGRAVKFNRESLLYGLRSTAYAMATNDVRYYLNGMQIREHDGGWRVAATNGHRLAIVQVPCVTDSGPLQTKPDNPLGVSNLSEAIIPNSVVQHVLKIMKDQGDGSVLFSLTASKGRFSTQNVSIEFSLIDGKFPDIDRLIPKSSDLMFCVHRKKLVEAVTRVSIVLDGTQSGLVLSLDSERLILSCQGNVDSGEDSVSLEHIKGNVAAKTAFHPAYLLQALTAIPGEKVLFNMNGESASLLTDQESKDLHLIMPQRI